MRSLQRSILVPQVGSYSRLFIVLRLTSSAVVACPVVPLGEDCIPAAIAAVLSSLTDDLREHHPDRPLPPSANTIRPQFFSRRKVAASKALAPVSPDPVVPTPLVPIPLVAVRAPIRVTTDPEVTAAASLEKGDKC